MINKSHHSKKNLTLTQLATEFFPTYHLKGALRQFSITVFYKKLSMYMQIVCLFCFFFLVCTFK